ncbi:HD domain-containing protein [Candidatus Methylomirabilis sp.]|uniref:HD domain-containing protein n=1 Tax=Candidatus Methylomirabilis sp. TaxID=2032687 RepID=UPI002A5CEEC5|nr:HD domain-containing protein [Candidatus Methylomirabilis sp.]
MAKNIHEIRDPIHVFVRLDSHERQVLDSRPFQRLRHIHQLALSHLVYPGCTHRRFEHSLGVMELAGRVFDVITQQDAITDEIKQQLPQISCTDALAYWKRVLRMAALCHDIGHLPFSHTSEDLLPAGWTHEILTAEIIKSAEMQDIWQNMTPPLRAEDIVKLAIGPKKAAKVGVKAFSDWEAILAEIIVGDAFGVDRMDYLLRDSYHAGVTYGKFDHYRLIDTLRILTPPPVKKTERMEAEGRSADDSKEVMLGIEVGGLHSAESLLLARYFMFMQVYCHPVRRIYDIHLRDFLKEWLPHSTFSTDIEQHLAMTDIEVMHALRGACCDEAIAGHKHAKLILHRKHFKVLYARNPDDTQKNPDAVATIHTAVSERFGEANVRIDTYTQSGGAPEFPVLENDGRIVSSLAESQPLRNLPVVATGYVFINRDCREKAKVWLEGNRDDILAKQEGEEEG